MKEMLSYQEARKLVLLSQRLPPPKQSGRAIDVTQQAIDHLGYVQIDAISVVQRAHHHTLWNRNPRYKTSHLNELLRTKQVFEYWSHAAAYLPMRDFRFSLVRKHELASGQQKHWYARDEKMMKWVLKRIADEGPLMAKDFEHFGKRVGEWKAKPAKQALEYLFMEGDLMVPYRNHFHKVYDLPERVLPSTVDTRLPDLDEYARYLILRYLRTNGLGQAAEIAYLPSGKKPLISETLDAMVSSGELLEIEVAGKRYFSLPSSLELLGKSLSRSRLKILSPFDNLVIQRKRMQALFGFDYLIECYVPKQKRRYGYFCLPILWDGSLVARMDCKVERAHSLLQIHHLALEPAVTKTEAFFRAFRKELSSFLRFNDCKQLRIHRTTPDSAMSVLQNAVGDLLGGENSDV